MHFFQNVYIFSIAIFLFTIYNSLKVVFLLQRCYMSESVETKELLGCYASIASAYLQRHDVSLEELPVVLKKIFQNVADVCCDATSAKFRRALTPAVPIEESVHPDYIICLEDGKKLQMLKRHLNTMYGMTVEQYKERWNLPMDYPVVSPNYAKRRSDIAKSTGLGNSSKQRTRAA